MSQRSDQVAEELRKIISMIMLDDMRDANLGFITITRIELTADLRFARVFYSVLGDEDEKKRSQALLHKHAAKIKRLAVQQINMRYAMDMRFELDNTIEGGFRIDEILKKIKDKEEPKES